MRESALATPKGDGRRVCARARRCCCPLQGPQLGHRRHQRLQLRRRRPCGKQERRSTTHRLARRFAGHGHRQQLRQDLRRDLRRLHWGWCCCGPSLQQRRLARALPARQRRPQHQACERTLQRWQRMSQSGCHWRWASGASQRGWKSCEHWRTLTRWARPSAHRRLPSQRSGPSMPRLRCPPHCPQLQQQRQAEATLPAPLPARWLPTLQTRWTPGPAGRRWQC